MVNIFTANIIMDHYCNILESIIITMMVTITY